METKRERLDVLFAAQTGYSREFCKEIIIKGSVQVNGQTNTKPGNKIPIDSLIGYEAPPVSYVSRGGHKLSKALKEFKIDIRDKICLDAGASTGGFTDCMLQAGAAIVYAVDSGRGQIDVSLKNDPRVISMEETNIRYLTLGKTVDFISADLSFISLTKVMDKLYELLKGGGLAVLLIKPQFEAGQKYLNKKGVVKDLKVHKLVINNISDFAKQIGFIVLDCIESPLRGQEGNIEYLLYIKK